jgi:hypothetical protein
MWRGPLAYGHATATRIFCGLVDSCCSFGADRTRGGDHTSRLDDHRSQAERRGDERREQQAVPVV